MKKTSAHWSRKLDVSAKPAYLLMADLIADDIRTGRLVARDRLPTLRELATDLGLNYTTVARGYAEARKRGLIDTHAGMGTYVRGGSPALKLRGGSSAEMTMNLPPEPGDEALIGRMREGAAKLLAAAPMWDLMRYQDFGGTAQDREAGLRWLQPMLPGGNLDRVLVCPGIHGALTALFSLLARPGELICVESLTYPGVKAIAAQLGIQLHALPLDDDGPNVDAFEHACKTLSPRALYCNPTLLNPTTSTFTLARREALADVALRYSMPIIEDDAYGMLPRDLPAPLAVLAPELTYYISGFSKCLGAGLRTAYVQAPTARHAQRLAGALRATTVMSSPITNALATTWVNDSTADEVLNAVRAESTARQAMAASLLAPWGVASQPECFHLWLPLGPACSPVEFASYLRTQGVGVVASAAFSTDGDPPDAVRICVGGPTSRHECELALQLIADTLAHPEQAHSTVM